jgi:uroporphyrinogen III methyltransferase/synthase
MGLEGKSILVTRSPDQSLELGSLLEDLGAEIISIPTIAIGPPETWLPADSSIQGLADYEWVIFTSANAVDAFLDRAGTMPDLKIAAVGSQTARRLQERDIGVDLVPEDFRAEGLIKSFPENLRGLEILLPRAESGSDLLPDTLRKRGAKVDVVSVYRNQLPTTGGGELRALLEAGSIDCITLTSGSTVRNLIQMLDVPNPLNLLSAPAIAVIGPVTRETAITAGLQVNIEPSTATVAALVNAIDEHFKTS